MTTPDTLELRRLRDRLDSHMGRANMQEVLADCQLAVVALDALLDRLDALEGREAWQPIETAPRDGSKVLLWFDCWPTDALQIGYCRPEEFGGRVIDFFCDGDGEQFESADDKIVWPTHWRPLPEAPTTLADEGRDAG